MSLHDPRYKARIAGHLAKYPDKRSAVMPLLYIAQEAYGWVSPRGIQEVAEICEMDPTQVNQIRFMLVGVGLALLMVFRPQGIFGSREEMMLDVR